MRRLSLVVLLAAACAHAPSTKPAEEAPPRHGMKGAHEPIALPHTVVETATGAELDEAQLAVRLRAAKVIYVGEQHPNPHDHAVELEVLERAYAADPSVGLGMEMLPRTLQAPLDELVGGRIDEAAFLAAVDWKKTWGYDFGLYRPLLAFARAHSLRAYALNAPRELAHAVAKRGLDGLTAEEKSQLPELVPGPEAHREQVREAFGAHPHGKFSTGELEKFYSAQLVWDETMADRVAAALAAPDAPARLVVVAGEGHTRRFAIPERAERRGARPSLTISPTFAEELDEARRENAADLLWVLHTH